MYFKTKRTKSHFNSTAALTKSFSYANSFNFKIILAALSLTSVLAYLLVVNNSNTMGIEIGEMQYRIKSLSDENRDLQNIAAQLKAMSRIEFISLTQLSMVPAGTYQYLNEQGAVAISKP